jgi:hypothetical protein
MLVWQNIVKAMNNVMQAPTRFYVLLIHPNLISLYQSNVCIHDLSVNLALK